AQGADVAAALVRAVRALARADLLQHLRVAVGDRSGACLPTSPRGAPAMSERNLDRLTLGALLLIALLRSLTWMAAYPVLKIADETSHFDNVQYRAEHRLRRAVQGPAQIDKVLGHGAAMELRRAWAATNHYFRDSFLRGRRIVPEEKELAERALNP